MEHGEAAISVPNVVQRIVDGRCITMCSSNGIRLIQINYGGSVLWVVFDDSREGNYRYITAGTLRYVVGFLQHHYPDMVDYAVPNSVVMREQDVLTSSYRVFGMDPSGNYDRYIGRYPTLEAAKITANKWADYTPPPVPEHYGEW